MIVDNLKSCYRTLMRIRLEPELIVPVRWYFAPPGALPLPTETAFGSSVWETVDREYPQPGLGEVDLVKTWDKGLPPAGVTGLSTRTPLDWFVDGLPADYVYPPPNPCVPATIAIAKEGGPLPGSPATVTDEGALTGLAEELVSIRRWQFLLFVWPAAITDTTTFADLIEASFPGYARLTPTWSAPVLTGPGEATSYAGTLTWTRAAGGGLPQTVFGWAAVGPGAPVELRQIQLFAVPITITSAGDNVSLGPLLITYNPEVTDMPTGGIIPFAGSLVPTGYLACDGADHADADYPELSAALAHTWDTFRGQSAPAAGRFRTPRLNGLGLIGVGAAASNPATSARTLASVVGAEAVQLTVAELAAHAHSVTDPGHNHQPLGATAFVHPDNQAAVAAGAGAFTFTGAVFNTNVKSTGITLQSAGADDPHENMPPCAAILWCVKT